MDIIGIKPTTDDHESNFKKVGAIPSEPFGMALDKEKVSVMEKSVRPLFLETVFCFSVQLFIKPKMLIYAVRELY